LKNRNFITQFKLFWYFYDPKNCEIKMETILNHRTIRNYASDPVSDAVLQEILKAGTRASTTGNMQVYSIIVTRNQSIK
jgi:hypothetical protein